MASNRRTIWDLFSEQMANPVNILPQLGEYLGETATGRFEVINQALQIVTGIHFRNSGERSASTEYVCRKMRTFGKTWKMFEEDFGTFTNLAFANVAK